jgi:transcriptional regulator with XRE-family HTH domain
MTEDIALGPVIERIEARLERMEMPPEAAFKAAGLPSGFLDRLRQGKAPLPRGQRLVKLAEALGTSVAYLVGLDPDAMPPQELLEEEQGSLGLLAGDEEALLRAYRRLDVSSRAASLHVLLKMAGPEPEPEPRNAPRRRHA